MTSTGVIKFLRQGYRYHKIRKTFSNFYRRHSRLVEKYNVSFRKLLQQRISEPEFYDDLVYKISASCFIVFPCSLSSCFAIPFSIVITSLGEDGAGLYASRAFVCFVRVSFCHVSRLGVGGWQRFVIVALPGLFYFFFFFFFSIFIFINWLRVWLSCSNFLTMAHLAKIYL